MHCNKMTHPELISVCAVLLIKPQYSFGVMHHMKINLINHKVCVQGKVLDDDDDDDDYRYSNSYIILSAL